MGKLTDKSIVEFERMLDFVSSAEPEDWRGLDYPLLLERFNLELSLSEGMMQSLFGMTGFEIVDRLRMGDYLCQSLINEKYYGCVANK